MMGSGRVGGKQSDATETRPGRFEYLRQNLYSYLPHLIANYRTVGASRVGLFQCRRPCAGVAPQSNGLARNSLLVPCVSLLCVEPPGPQRTS